MKSTPSLMFDINGFDKKEQKEQTKQTNQPLNLKLKTIYYTPTPWVWPERVKAAQEAYKKAQEERKAKDARLRNPDGTYNLDLVGLED